jgi:hypothetical protein
MPIVQSCQRFGPDKNGLRLADIRKEQGYQEKSSSRARSSGTKARGHPACASLDFPNRDSKAKLSLAGGA